MKCFSCDGEIDIENECCFIYMNNAIEEDAPLLCLTCVDKIRVKE